METSNIENWYKFTAYNSDAIYAFGTQADAETYCDQLNCGKEINLYSVEIAGGSDDDYCYSWGDLQDLINN